MEKLVIELSAPAQRAALLAGGFLVRRGLGLSVPFGDRWVLTYGTRESLQAAMLSAWFRGAVDNAYSLRVGLPDEE